MRAAELASRAAKDAEGYLVDSATGEKIIFYTCDPSKNTGCDKRLCRHEHPEGVGFCSSTPEREYQAEGTRPFYKRLNGEGYFGREYIDEEGTV